MQKKIYVAGMFDPDTAGKVDAAVRAVAGDRMCDAMFRKDLSLKNRNDEDCKRVFFKKENVDLETMINACEKMGFIRG